MTKPIVVEVTKDGAEWPAGAELGFASAKDASKILGDGNYKITRFVDSSEYVAEPEPAEPEKVKK